MCIADIHMGETRPLILIDLTDYVSSPSGFALSQFAIKKNIWKETAMLCS